jgi:hypothetical protein
MAGANLPAKKYSKTSPTVTRLSFEGSGDATKFIDIARALSIINRKFYRQGVYYYVNSVELYNSEDAYIDIHTLPDTWVTKNAWNRGFGIFQDMNALVDTPRPKYHDFKVLMSTIQTSDGANTMDPDMYGLNGTNASLAPDEWIYSQITTMHSDGGAPDEFELTMLGTHSGSQGGRSSVGLIKSYQDSRAQPDSSGAPIVSTNARTDPLSNLFDASGDNAMENIIENLDENNDVTPYDANAYLGHSNNHMQHVARLATSQITGRVVKSSGFCAPMGLICVDPADSTNSSWRIVLNIAQGTYHGVYAERA